LFQKKILQFMIVQSMHHSDYTVLVIFYCNLSNSAKPVQLLDQVRHKVHVGKAENT